MKRLAKADIQGKAAMSAALRTVWSGAMLLVLAFTASSAFANGERIYIECPCTFERTDDDQLAITAGFRSFRDEDTQYLRLDVFAKSNRAANRRTFVGHVLVEELVEAGATTEPKTYYGTWTPSVENSNQLDEPLYLLINLYREWNRSGGYQDVVLGEETVNIKETFSIGELDYLTDTDGDGVSDRNESEEGTDPNDAESFPGDSTIDILGMYSQGFEDFHNGDPYTRIRHIVTTTNSISGNSGLDFRFRLVGMVKVEVDDYSQFSSINIVDMDGEADRHGADIGVVFKGAPDSVNFICGYTYITGWGMRGYMPILHDRLYTGYVLSGCPGDTTAHEIGHILGLGHSEWQDEIGSWRWARGHAVESTFHTVMSYGGLGGTKSTVFSNPDLMACFNNPCGIDEAEELGANAVRALNAIRFQFANIRESFPDTDEDGFVDPVDAVPDDPDDWLDTDGDGIGNNTDLDDDGDGFIDALDAFPLDPDEFLDSDLDGVGNNTDVFPFNPDEQYDTDGDGVGDNADPFPLDPNESVDTDGDGVGDNSDAFPDNADEHTDTDGDGIGNNADTDDDGDGTLDEVDAYPLDPARTDFSSFQFIGEETWDAAGAAMVGIGDIDGDGANEFMVSAQLWDDGDVEGVGTVYIISYADLDMLDMEDGSKDREIQLEHTAAGEHSWIIRGTEENGFLGTLLTTGDIDGDGTAELLLPILGATNENGVASGAVYIIFASDLSRMDAEDGTTDRVVNINNYSVGLNSMRIVGTEDGAGVGVAVSAGDADGNGRDDLLIGAPSTGEPDADDNEPGIAYFVPDSLLHVAGAIATSGPPDLNLDDALENGDVTALVGGPGDTIGTNVSLQGDYDGDGIPELTIAGGNYGTDNIGAIFIIPYHVLDDADTADGTSDNRIDPISVQITPDTWTIDGALDSLRGLRFIADSDMDGDGRTELIVRVDYFLSTYVVSGADLAAADEQDYSPDRRISIDNTPLQPGSFLVYGMTSTRDCCWPAATNLDTDGDGLAELLVGGDYWIGVSFGGVVHYTYEQLIETYKTQRDILSNEIYEGWVIALLTGWQAFATNSWFIGTQSPNGIGLTVGSVGDLDGDGGSDIALGAPLSGHSELDAGMMYLIYSSELKPLSARDGTDDLFSELTNVAGETDGDGILNTVDTDDDGDTHVDVEDIFPRIATEWADFDEDGWGDNLDAFPEDDSEWFDSDGDGVGNNTDEDDDGDGIPDTEDDYPRDTDNDGTTNRYDDDDDGDGVDDDDDADPIDPDVS